jgi:Fe-S-cluster containining protein
MKGRENFNSGTKCVALGGEIGKKVGCTVYEDRPDVCRKYDRVLENGKINPRCAQARKAYGLNPTGY